MSIEIRIFSDSYETTRCGIQYTYCNVIITNFVTKERSVQYCFSQIAQIVSSINGFSCGFRDFKNKLEFKQNVVLHMFINQHYST